MAIGLKKMLVLVVIVVLFIAYDGSAETATDGNISISIDIPDYVPQNETFLINLSAVDISAYPVTRGYIYLDAVLLNRSWMYFYDSYEWNKTIQAIFRGGVGGIEWYMPSDKDYTAGQTIPVKFRAQKVTHTIDFRVVFWPIGYGHSTSAIMIEDNVTAIPVFDPSVHVTVSNGSAAVFEATSGKGVDFIRFSEGSQQYIVNWDTSGNPPGEYYIRAGFDNGYENETRILLH